MDENIEALCEVQAVLMQCVKYLKSRSYPLMDIAVTGEAAVGKLQTVIESLSACREGI